MLEIELGRDIPSLVSHKSLLKEAQEMFQHDAYSKSVKVSHCTILRIKESILAYMKLTSLLCLRNTSRLVLITLHYHWGFGVTG
jgi:hypothetical protein